MAKFYLVGDATNNDLWLINTQDKTMSRVDLGKNEDAFGDALAAFASHGGTVVVGDSEVEMKPRALAKAVYQSALRGMSICNVQICIASDASPGEINAAKRDVGDDDPPTRRLD